MKRVFCFFFMMVCATFVCSQVKVQNLLVENLSNPIGLDVASPRFTWQLSSEKRNVMQTAYEIRVGTNAVSLAKGKDLYWSSGKVSSDSSVHIVYKGKPLESGNKYYWQVRVWDNEGKASAWSGTENWQTGFFDSTEWKAKWIEPGFTEDSVLRPAVHFRKEFQAGKKIQSATAYITAHGIYEALINGKRVGDAYLTPGWTSYNKRLQYQVYDVTDHLRQGGNVIGATVSNGWYRGHLAWGGNKNIWGKDISLLLQIDIVYSDGSRAFIVSDGSWKSSTGSIIFSEIYDGEIIDARKEKTGWFHLGYNDAAWSGVREKNYSKSVLVATENEMIKKHERFSTVKVLATPKGERVIDFGQNLVGWVTVKLKGKAGDTVTISHAEVLDKYGNFYTDNLRAAKAQAVYVLKGDGEEIFEPHFTFFGFRYIKIEGLRGEIQPANFTAVALYSDMRPSGTFTCSNPLIDQLQHNIQWGQKGNFLDVPTDCPQRDERLGWTGDAQAFFRTAAFNMHVNNFFAKWMKDVAADQLQSGSVPFVIPNVLGQSGGSTGWADAATIIPWDMYLLYGDKRVLEQQYSSMKAWVGYMTRNSRNDLWNQGFHFGDWLFYRPFDDNDGRSAVTDKYLIAQSFFAHSTQLLINTAKTLGKTEDVKTYTALLKRIKDAYLKEYVTPNGRLVSGTQTAYILALNFDMLPESMRGQASERLVDNIKSYGIQLTTGFLGTPYLCHVLTRFGHDTLAYKLLFRQSYPSWLYPVKMGATTIWERWDGIKPDSTFQTPTMNSFNHYAYGAIGDWMYRSIAGINTDEDAPGYKKIIIQPRPTDSLSFASASLHTYYGKISSGWKRENGNFILDVEIPANTTATIYIPAKMGEEVTESGKRIAGVPAETKEHYVVVKAGSGKYSFAVNRKKDM